MTIGDVRAMALKLVDDYSENGAVTIDADMELKIADFINAAQMAVCQVVPLRKVLELNIADGAVVGNTVRFQLPERMKRLIAVYADGLKRGCPNLFGKYLVVRKNILDGASLVELEYEALPMSVKGLSDNTPLELNDDACTAVAYHVAYSVLAVDPVYDNSRIWNIYQNQIVLLRETERSRNSSMTVISDGVL